MPSATESPRLRDEPELLKGSGTSPGREPGAGSETGAGAQPARPRILVCRACRRAITGAEARTEVDGSHEHTFFNPAGVLYRLGCFREAPGCAAAGPFRTFFTWFPGHAWQLALCGGCARHLGWCFRGESSFHGLVLAELVEIEQPDDAA